MQDARCNISAPTCTRFELPTVSCRNQMGMRRPVSGRAAVSPQVIDALEAQEVRGDRHEKDITTTGKAITKHAFSEIDHRLRFGRWIELVLCRNNFTETGLLMEGVCAQNPKRDRQLHLLEIVVLLSRDSEAHGIRASAFYDQMGVIGPRNFDLVLLNPCYRTILSAWEFFIH